MRQCVTEAGDAHKLLHDSEASATHVRQFERTLRDAHPVLVYDGYSQQRACCFVRHSYLAQDGVEEWIPADFESMALRRDGTYDTSVRTSLPEGWEERRSQTTGVVYYFNKSRTPAQYTLSIWSAAVVVHECYAAPLWRQQESSRVPLGVLKDLHASQGRWILELGAAGYHRRSHSGVQPQPNSARQVARRFSI